jgi:hypothetical protein
MRQGEQRPVPWASWALYKVVDFLAPGTSRVNPEGSCFCMRLFVFLTKCHVYCLDESLAGRKIFQAVFSQAGEKDLEEKIVTIMCLISQNLGRMKNVEEKWRLKNR